MEWFIFLLAFIVKFLMSMIISSDVVLVLSTLSIILLYSFMLYKKISVYHYIPFVMLDYSLVFYYCYLEYGASITSIYMSFIIFMFSSSFMYYLILIVSSDFKKMKKIANMEIDKGIKALENRDYESAIESFSNAIKDHKTNYLGYMGMCNTLTNMDKINLKKLEYYKKKCIKYAPKELKKSIYKRF